MPNVSCIILARGGSKRIPNKNIISVGGKPLVFHTINSFAKSNLVQNIIVSSDSSEILELVSSQALTHKRLFGADDNDSSELALQAVIHDSPELFRNTDWILLAQATSPFRYRDTIHRFLSRLDKLNPTPILCLLWQ